MEMKMKWHPKLHKIIDVLVDVLVKRKRKKQAKVKNKVERCTRIVVSFNSIVKRRKKYENKYNSLCLL